jgi:hypothetical protein
VLEGSLSSFFITLNKALSSEVFGMLLLALQDANKKVTTDRYM